jgi:hypothetical protein
MMVKYELERMWKELTVVWFNVLSRHLYGRTEKIHVKSQLSWSVSRPRFEQGAFRIQVRSVTATLHFEFHYGSIWVAVMVTSYVQDLVIVSLQFHLGSERTK